MAGLGLPELLVAVALVALAACTVQPLWAVVFDWLGTDMARALGSSLQLARSEAIKTASRATVCKSADGQRCNSAGNWGQGWIVFQDRNHDGQRDAGEPLVQVQAGLPARWLISGNASVAHYVSFQADGSPALVSGAFQAGTFTVCRATGSSTGARLLIMSATGRLRVQSTAATSCA
jgi:type IV fimbrial biogenesis protein FimT